MAIKRYTMYGTPGGYQEREDETGEWVRYSDMKKLISYSCSRCDGVPVESAKFNGLECPKCGAEYPF